METPGLSTTRIAAFSDSVFAFAATLLVLNIKIPEVLPTQLTTELPRQVLHLWPQLLSYMMSFVIVGIYWVAHHVMFHHIKRSDRVLLWLNIAFLMCIAFIPFPTGLISRYGAVQTAVVVYAGTLTITGVLLEILWWYATRGHYLVEKELPDRVVRLGTIKTIIAPCAYALSIAVSFLSPKLCILFFVAVPAFYILPSSLDRHLLKADG
jgi:TMEM175 potassium channel family protein